MRILPIINFDSECKNNYRQKFNNFSYSNAMSADEFISLTNNNNKLKKMISFTGDSVNNNFKFKDISDNEFYELIEKIEGYDYGFHFKPFERKELCSANASKWSVQLLEHINQIMKNLDKKDIRYQLCQDYVLSSYNGRAPYVKTKESAEIIARMLEMSWLFDQTGELDFEYTLSNMNPKLNKEQAKIKRELLDKLEENHSNESLKYSSYNQWNNIHKIITNVNSEKALDVAKKMLDYPKILITDDKLDLDDRFFDSISNNSKHADIVSKSIDKIVKNPEILDKKYSTDFIGKLLKFDTNDYCDKFAQKILDNPQLFDDHIIWELIICLMNYPNEDNDDPAVRSEDPEKLKADYSVIREYLEKHLDLLIQYPDLSTNEDFKDIFTLVPSYLDDVECGPSIPLSVLADDIRHHDYFTTGGLVNQFCPKSLINTTK